MKKSNIRSNRKLQLLFTILIIIVMIGILFDLFYDRIRMVGTQIVPIKAATDTDIGAINQNQKFVLPDTLEIDTQYTITIQYIIVEKRTKGNTLFSSNYRTSISDNDNVAQFGCAPIKVTSTFYANKKHITADVGLIATPDKISDKSGNYFDNKTHQLLPVIMISPTGQS